MSEQNYIERYWRDATPADAIREPPMVARFRNVAGYNWFIGPLMGIRRDNNYPWYSTNIGSFEQCQVYDAPDPGEGWRLIDTEKDDYNQNGVEYWNIGQKRWLPRYLHNDKTSFLQDGFYRIRIEQPKPKYEPFRWEDREQLRGRWYELTLSCGEIRECQIEFLRLDRNVFFIGSFPSDELLQKNARFLDTGEPVGRRVE